MEVVEIPRISSNGGKADVQCNINEEEERETKTRSAACAVDLGGGTGRFYGWPSSSRIVRVSRASGGKDRHCKVLTIKGLRDRRVRLSVNTAIQFHDLQDRLGYYQPSAKQRIGMAAECRSEFHSGAATDKLFISIQPKATYPNQQPGF